MKKITKCFLLFILFSASSLLAKQDTTHCIWKSQVQNFYAWDSCQGNGGQHNSVNAYISIKNTCLKYTWTLNGVSQSNRSSVVNYKVKTNGTYTLCVKVTDTCNKCDTTFCSTRTITCFTPCLWKSKTYFYVVDSCQGKGGHNSITSYVSIKNNSCYKYQWSINGTLQSTKNYYINYPISANGTYAVCVKILDTCNKCDTTYCSTRSFTCLSNCNWKSKSSSLNNFDSCQGNGGHNSINAYFGINNRTCLKYVWSINGVTQPTKNYYINYPITQNGKYDLCVKVTDTCNKCDTTFCSSRTITCFNSGSGTCHWYQRKPYYYSWDTCKGNGGANSLNAYISFQSFYCLKYSWTVNGVAQTTNSNLLHYKINANGSYVLCVKVIDTCNKCDTTFCTTKSVTCFNPCNWKNQTPYFSAWDTCKGKGGANSINAYISFKNRSCQKYVWSVNGIAQTTKNYYINYPITKNGTYTLCVKVIDTCNKCDTSFCSTRTISCFPTCNWKAKSPSLVCYDSCAGNGGNNSLNAYLGINSRSCLKYIWSVNGVVQTTKNYYIHYPIYKNGAYSMCVKVIDTCNNCDTTICSTRNITCFNTCNWKSNSYFYSWDTCKGTGGVNSVNAYLSIKNGTCNKYSWTINGVSAGRSNIMHHAISQNGTYNICVKVTDTCKKCDTTYCSTRTITCFSGCNFKARTPYFNVWDSCVGSRSSINGYITFYNKSCMKYEWTLAGNKVGNGDRLISVPVYKNGSYVLCVKVTDTCNHCDTTICVTKSINCSGLNINNQLYKQQIALYPNPANDLIHMDWVGETLGNNNLHFDVYDIVGHIISEGKLNQGSNIIATSVWSNGVYFVRVFTSEGERTMRVIISR